MKNKVIGSVVGAALLAGSGAVVADDYFAAENFSSTLTFTTDYVFRGTTFSNNDPAIQGSFDWGYGPWFAGAWASSLVEQDVLEDFSAVNDGGGNMELDLYFGWADNVAGIDLMVMPLWYTFPGQEGGANGGRDDQTFELWTSAGYGFANLPGAPYVAVGWDWSDSYFDNGDESNHYHASVAFSLPEGFGIDFYYGYQDVGGEGENDFFADDYEYWNVGITKSAAGFDFDVRWHNNEDKDDINFDGAIDFAMDDDLVLSVSRSF